MVSVGEHRKLFLITNKIIGVNDAPSLKKADCGIAVEGASEAAQAAADIVFLAPGLSTIVLAIKTAREIFQRMKAYIQYRVSVLLYHVLLLSGPLLLIAMSFASIDRSLSSFGDLPRHVNDHYQRDYSCRLGSLPRALRRSCDGSYRLRQCPL